MHIGAQARFLFPTLFFSWIKIKIKLNVNFVSVNFSFSLKT